MVKTKSRMRLEIKDITAAGTFEGLLSPYGNVDQGADVVEPGAYAKTLKDQGSTRPLLWQHKSDVPIGQITLDDRPDGLWCSGQLLMQLPEAQKAYLLIKAQIVKGLSIGFQSIKDEIEGGIRKLKEIKLYEGSIVTFPMNEMALITGVKGKESKGDFNEELTEQQLSDAGYQMISALGQALRSVVWSGLTREEQISATETIIQQFSDAYNAYFPAYIDMLAEMFGDMETYNAKRMERKAGAKWSAADKETMKSACDMIDNGHAMVKSGNDSIRALFDTEAGTSTSDTKAAPKTEPAACHSAIESVIGSLDSMMSLIPAA